MYFFGPIFMQLYCISAKFEIDLDISASHLSIKITNDDALLNAQF